MPRIFGAIAIVGQRQLAASGLRIELDGVSRQYKTPRILDDRVVLADYEGELRQIAVANLGHEEPTLLLTNQLQRSATKMIDRYARRMLIENNIDDGIVSVRHGDCAIAMVNSCGITVAEHFLNDFACWR